MDKNWMNHKAFQNSYQKKKKLPKCIFKRNMMEFCGQTFVVFKGRINMW